MYHHCDASIVNFLSNRTIYICTASSFYMYKTYTCTLYTIINDI